MTVKDYLANLVVDPGDKLDHGVKGMRWGITRSRAQRRAAAAQRAAAPKEGGADHVGNAAKKSTVAAKPSTTEAKKPSSNIQDHVESSPARYARLQAEAKAGGASKMTEQDLKFFNARTEALAKINKLNETEPGWLSKTSKKVLQQTAQNQMQTISDGIANKYISGPIIDSIKKS
jgi:hypothetical protein